MANQKKNYSLKRNYQPVGAYLREMRIKADLTQVQVADALGYSSPQFISNFEAGIAVPPMNRLGIMIKLYKMDVAILFDIILRVEREVMFRKLESFEERRA